MANGKSKSLHIFFTALILCITLQGLSAPVLAGEEASPANITIKLPELQLSQELEEEVSHLSVESVLDQVQMDESAAEVVLRINEAIAGLTDIEADVKFTEVRGERQEVVTLRFIASLVHKMVRMEFNSPSALRGQVYVADRAAMEVRIYTPVNNHIMIQKIEDLGNQAAGALNLSDLDLEDLFDFTRYQVEVSSVSEEDGITTYELKVSGFDEQVQIVEVRNDTFIPHAIREYEGDVLIRTLTFENVITDQGLSAETIAKLPAVKEMRL